MSLWEPALLPIKDNSVRNQEYKDFVVAFFRQRLDCEIAYYDNPNPDETLLYMAHAHWIMVAMGGYSQIAAALVRARRGRNHVWHDKFNGHIAGWDSGWFDAYRKQVYAADYIDWSQQG